MRVRISNPRVGDKIRLLDVFDNEIAYRKLPPASPPEEYVGIPFMVPLHDRQV